MKDFYQQLTDITAKLIHDKYGVELDMPLWELPAKREFGDLSSSAAMRLASRFKKNPLEIAGELKNLIAPQASENIEKIEILKPGFINLFISRPALLVSLGSLLSEEEPFFHKQLKRKVLIEFVSANPTGPISIAHGRQAVIGDTIANILKFCGNAVTREYYINDEGKQIDLLVESVKARAEELKGNPLGLPEGGYQGEYIKDVAKAWQCSGQDCRQFSLEHILGWIKNDLESLGVKFDTWRSQYKLINEGKVAQAIEALQEKGFLHEKEGALWFNSTAFGDDKDRVIKKADGELTYFASDIAYHKEKMERGFQLLINLWGPDHHGYIPRVKAALEALGYDKDALNILIIQLVTLKTKEKMSKRKGTAILVSDLIGEVGIDAARFYYLTRRNSSHLEFDVDLAKQASLDNPLYYIQYSCARIESIFKKAGSSQPDIASIQRIETEPELLLLRVLLEFTYVLDKAYFCLEPVFIVEYLKDLAAAFHKFYENVKVIGSDKELTAARLSLLWAVRLVLHTGLKILGLTPAEQM